MKKYLIKNALSLVLGSVFGILFGVMALNSRQPVDVVMAAEYVPEVVVCDEDQMVEKRLITDGERDVLAAIVWAEAGNQDLDGKRLVVDVVLNRVDDERFPDDIVSVVFQKYQFWTKGMPRKLDGLDECYQAVDMELEGQLNTEVLYFRTRYYHSFGTPVLNHGDHYFSK